MPKYIVIGHVPICIVATIEAETAEEAESMMGSFDRGPSTIFGRDNGASIVPYADMFRIYPTSQSVTWHHAEVRQEPTPPVVDILPRQSSTEIISVTFRNPDGSITTMEIA